MRSGAPFEPMPEDVKMVDSARSARLQLTPGSPAHRLFEEIERYGERSITRKLETDVDVFGEPE
jgi:hypothetical protein